MVKRSSFAGASLQMTSTDSRKLSTPRYLHGRHHTSNSNDANSRTNWPVRKQHYLFHTHEDEHNWLLRGRTLTAGCKPACA